MPDKVRVEVQGPLFHLPWKIHEVEKGSSFRYGSFPPGRIIDIQGDENGNARVIIMNRSALNSILCVIVGVPEENTEFRRETDVIVSDGGLVTGSRGILGTICVKGRHEI